MGASRPATRWENFLHRIPGFTLYCPAGNRHFRWQTICLCCQGEDGWGIFLHHSKSLWVDITGHKGVLRNGVKPPLKTRTITHRWSLRG